MEWKWIDFCDIDLILKTTPVCWMSNFAPNRFSAPYLLNQNMNSDKILCIVSLGKLKDFIKFLWPWHNFQGHHTINTVKMNLVCILSQMNLVCILSPEPIAKKYLWNKGKKILDFGDLGLIFNVTSALWMSNFDSTKACLHPTSRTKWWIQTKLHVLYHWAK